MVVVERKAGCPVGDFWQGLRCVTGYHWGRHGLGTKHLRTWNRFLISIKISPKLVFEIL